MKRIYLNEILPLINRKDIRSAEKWCKSNNIDIYKDISGRFIYKSEFNYVNDLPFIEKLIEKYGEKWEYIYELYKKDKVYLLKKEGVKEPEQRYIPQSDLSRNF